MPEAFEFDLVCIGSGPAGQRAAVQAAKIGKRVAVIEKGSILGGVCIETGTIPSKTFREAVLALAKGDARPTVEQLLAKVSAVVRIEAEIISRQLRRNDIEVIGGEASFKDAHTLVIQADSEVRTITAANVLIAVGTHPSPPPGVDPHDEIVISSDDIMRLKRLPRTMAVVGAGVIGIEYASMFARLGVEVTLIDQRPRALDFMDWEIVDELVHQMRGLETTFRFGEKVKAVEIAEGPSRRAAVLLESGKKIVSDAILFSVGRTGSTERLNAESIGIKPDERGRIKVDEQFRTSVPHVFAAGDVIGYPSLAATSSEQGRLAACHAFNYKPRPMASHFPIGIYSIPELSMVGLTEQALTEQKVPYETGLARYREIARGQILGDDSGMLKMIFQRETRVLLGVHAIGTGATELIHIGQAVLALGGGLDYFIDTVFNYPTLAECYKVAALDAYNKLSV